MTVPPAAANRSSILALTSGDAPQPQSSPKVIVPSATSEIRTPDLPKSLYLTRFPPVFMYDSSGGASATNIDDKRRRLRLSTQRRRNHRVDRSGSPQESRCPAQSGSAAGGCPECISP